MILKAAAHLNVFERKRRQSMQAFRVVLALAAAVPAAGCTALLGSSDGGTLASAAAPGAPNSSAGTWQMPWQLSPIGPKSNANGEETSLAFVPQTGFVRGTRTALASIGTPLREAPGPNRTVQACQEVVRGEASKIGAREVEAVSAGPHERNRKGQYVGRVEMRITYARPGEAYEVRQATMTCIVDRKDKIVDAFA